MSGYKSFAVAGAGNVGLPIVHALAAQNVSVNRPPKNSHPACRLPRSTSTIVAAISAVLKAHKVDVVLSTVPAPAAAAQKPLVDAAKLAKVKLFAPSEYGMPSDGHSEGVQGEKNKLVEYLKTVGIPSTRFYTGMFFEVILPFFGYSDNKKFTIVGTGEAPVSFTSVPDIAGFVAYVLTTLPPSELENSIFRLEGDRLSLNDLATQLKATVEHVDYIDGATGPFRTYLLGILDSGAGSTGWDEATKTEGSGINGAGSSNALWPGHHWRTAKEVLNI
ncbi:hypothetical protein B0H14DRAFT_3087920 [Mycena olivaceomarginata]|nr:hypothetical protein B0H14DRAFT_3087920 [Mycena olivaceomarginata]